MSATDLGVVYRAAGQTQWTRLGGGLPTTTVMDLSVGPDGNLYAAHTAAASGGSRCLRAR